MKIKVIIIVIAVLILVAGVYFIISKRSEKPTISKTQLSAPTIQQPITKSQSAIKTEKQQQKIIDSNNWQTYQNEEYGFQLNYPISLDVVEDAEDLIEKSKNYHGSLEVFFYHYGDTYKEYSDCLKRNLKDCEVDFKDLPRPQLIVGFRPPESFYQNNKLVNKRFVITVAVSPSDDEEKCETLTKISTAENSSYEKSKNSNLKFKHDLFLTEGMSQYAQGDIYSTFYNNNCWHIILYQYGASPGALTKDEEEYKKMVATEKQLTEELTNITKKIIDSFSFK